MISIEQWRARIGLFNNKRGCSGLASLLFPPVFFHYCYRKNVRSREYSSITDPSSSSLPPAEEHPPTAHSTADLTSPAKSLSCSTTTFSSSSSSGGLFSLRHSLLRDVLIILLITIISQQLLMSGDIETNPGPRRGADNKPGLDDLLYMSYTGENGRDVHFRLMDQLRPYWKRLAIALKFPLHEIAIMKQEDDPVFYILGEWLRGANQEKDPRPVTWRTLIEALRHANVQEEANVLEEHLIEISVTAPNSDVELHFTNDAKQKKGSFSTLVERLKQVYQAPPPTWDPLPQCGHIKLAMIGGKGKRRGITDEEMVKHQMKGAVETIMASKVPIEKDKMFDRGLFYQEHRVILVEGPPGGGKTSLAYYYGQKWASGNLRMFDIVAFVRLRDLAVTPANTLPDLLLLACCATKDDELIKKEMIQQYIVNCSPKLLLVLDGWDEVPNDVRNLSYVAKILHSITSQSKILITSRPDSSVELHGLANRVEIVGFTDENIHEYFKEALFTELDCDKVEDGCRKLQEHFRSYPVIKSCCSIPLNAAILVSLFLSEQSLPSTRHELFLKLVLNRINREQQDRHSQQNIEYVCVSSLDDLPHDLRVQLNHLCVLAFEGVKQNKVVFTEKDLDCQKLPHDLGVLQIVDSFIATGRKTAYCYFIHLSIQELLAAYHISQLEEDEQVKVFKAMLDEPRFSAVLQFFAAFNRLTNQGVRNIFTARDFDSKRSSKLRLLSFIRCFFEAQIHDDTSLYQQIIPKLNRGIDLSHVTMTPLDCMSIGYFMASLLTAGSEVSVDLSRCSIDDYMLGLLAGEFSRHAEVCPSGVMQAGVTELDISGNNKITGIGIAHVLRTNITNKLKANFCGISMESLVIALATKSSLEELDISNNIDIGDIGIGGIATALQSNTTLKILNISKCVRAVSWSPPRLDTGDTYNRMIPDCSAVIARQKKNLKTFNSSSSGISDSVAESIARALEVNSSLEELNIIDDNISDNGLVHIAKSLQKNNTLKVLHVGTERYKKFTPFTFTDTGVMSLARGVATNTSMEYLCIRWFSTNPDSTLKRVAGSIKNSSLKTLVLVISIGIWIPLPGEVTEWYQRVAVGGNELILSLEDSRHLKSFELRVPDFSRCERYSQFQTVVASVNSARHKKELPNISFSFGSFVISPLAVQVQSHRS